MVTQYKSFSQVISTSSVEYFLASFKAFFSSVRFTLHPFGQASNVTLDRPLTVPLRILIYTVGVRNCNCNVVEKYTSARRAGKASASKHLGESRRFQLEHSHFQLRQPLEGSFAYIAYYGKKNLLHNIVGNDVKFDPQEIANALSIRLPKLSALDGLSHAFFTRKLTEDSQLSRRRKSVDEEAAGSAAPSSSANLIEATLKSAAQAASVSPSTVFTVRQVHEANILHVRSSHRSRAEVCRQRYDALISARAGIALAVATADCVPVLLYDPVRRVIAAVHAGWRGAAAGIIERSVAQLVKDTGSRPADILAGIGPAIGACCYEVGRNVLEAFANCGSAVARTFQPSQRNHWQFDLPAAVGALLQQAGVPAPQIDCARLCTKCHPELFFSYRRDGNARRVQLNLIAMHD